MVSPQPQEQEEKCITVTKENYALAVSQMTIFKFTELLADPIGRPNGLGAFCHLPVTFAAVERTIPRPNFDTLYSMALMDLRGNPAVVTLPENTEVLGTNKNKTRYMSVWVISEDGFNPYDAMCNSGTYTVTEDVVGTRYCMMIARVQFDNKCEKDTKVAAMLQNRIKVEQQVESSTEVYRPMKWDIPGLMAMKKHYQVLEKVNDSLSAFGKKSDEVDFERHNIVTTLGFGGMTIDQSTYWMYPNVPVEPHIMIITDVPCQSFWSMTVYNESGFIQEGSQFFTVNSSCVKYNDDGSVTLYLASENRGFDNFLESHKNSSMIFRAYLPDEDFKSWKQPEFVPCPSPS